MFLSLLFHVSWASINQYLFRSVQGILPRSAFHEHYRGKRGFALLLSFLNSDGLGSRVNRGEPGTKMKEDISDVFSHGRILKEDGTIKVAEDLPRSKNWRLAYMKRKRLRKSKGEDERQTELSSDSLSKLFSVHYCTSLPAAFLVSIEPSLATEDLIADEVDKAPIINTAFSSLPQTLSLKNALHHAVIAQDQAESGNATLPRQLPIHCGKPKSKRKQEGSQPHFMTDPSFG